MKSFKEFISEDVTIRLSPKLKKLAIAKSRAKKKLDSIPMGDPRALEAKRRYDLAVKRYREENSRLKN